MFKKSKIAKIIEKGNQHYEKGELIDAKKMYLKGLAMEPDNIVILNNLAEIHSRLGDDAKTKGYSKILLKNCNKLLSHKKTKELLIIKANALLYLEKGNEINEVLDEILKIDPDNMTALFHKSHHLEKNRQHREALKYNERILKKYPYDIIALLSKGRNLVELNEFDEAEVCYNIILEIDPKNKAAINLKSTLFKKKNNWTITAHDLMFKAIENFEREHFSTSETYFKQAIEMNPNFDEIWFAQGELFIRTEKINKAIESFEKAFEINPTSGGIKDKKKLFKLLNFMKKVNTLLGYEK